MPNPTGVLSRELLPASIAIYVTVALAAFEALAVAAALPEVAADLGSVPLLPWVITAFLLTSGVATIVSGRLIDSLGLKTMFPIAVILFAGSGTAAAFVPTMPAMIAARALQGAGAGMVVAVGLAAVSLLYPPQLTGRAFAANSTVWGVMGVAGPGIAAFMLTQLDWRWIFLINLPLGLLALAAGMRVMPPARSGSGGRSVDVTGTLLALAFTLALLLAIDGLDTSSALWGTSAAAFGYLFYRHSGRSKSPVVERRYLGEAPFAPLALSISLLITGAIAANAFVPVYVRAGRLESAATAAWSVLFFTIGWTLGSNLSSRLLDTRPERAVIRYGFGLTTPGLVVTGTAALMSGPLPLVFTGLLLAGSGVGLSTNAALTHLRNISDPDEIGRSTAAHQFFRNQGFAIGSALGGALLFAVVTASIGDPDLVRQLLESAEPVAGRAAADAVANGFGISSLVGAGISALGILPLLLRERR